MKKPKKTERDNLIIDLITNEKSLAEIGRQFNITRQRVSQICKKRGLRKIFVPTEEWRKSLGAKLREVKNKKIKVADTQQKDIS